MRSIADDWKLVEQLWLAEREGQSPVVEIALTPVAAIDRVALARALDRVVATYDSLRARVTARGGELFGEVRDSSTTRIGPIDTRHVSLSRGELVHCRFHVHDAGISIVLLFHQVVPTPERFAAELAASYGVPALDPSPLPAAASATLPDRRPDVGVVEQALVPLWPDGDLGPNTDDLSAIRFIARARRRGLRVHMSDLLARPTRSQLARAVRSEML